MQRVIKHAEDADLQPDIWALTYYGPPHSMSFGPESDPYSYLGVVRWVLQHEADPVRFPAEDWPYLHDEFNDLAQWDHAANASADGHLLTLQPGANLCTRTNPWKPEYQVHFKSLKLGGGKVGVVFRAQDADNYYCWQFGDGTLDCTKIVNGQATVLKAGVKTPLKYGAKAAYVSIELTGSMIHTWMNLEPVDTLTDATFTAPGRVGLQTDATGEAELGPMLVY